MLVYGDRQIVSDPRDELERLDQEITALARLEGPVRHGRLAGLLITAGQLAQGLADAGFEARGVDDSGPMETAAMALVMSLAQAVAASWDGSEPYVPAGVTDPLRGLPLPRHVTLKTPEGYAYYALYPEAYLEAGRRLAPGLARVIGLRSIGTSLAAMAAVGADARPPLTLRPTGHPFAREMRVSPALMQALARPDVTYIVADEGPGLSGSSFGAAGDLLAQAGVDESRMAFLPSHAGDPGARASSAHLERWRRVRRPCVTFDELALKDGRLERWFEDLLGPAIAPLEDLSGGAWRKLRPDLEATPVWAQQERRKFLMRTDSGAWLLKFVGLGRIGEAKFARARRLAEAGFVPPPEGWRHGFLAEPWLHARAPALQAGREATIEQLGAYLAFRARALPAPREAGASMAELAAMASYNLEQDMGAASAPLVGEMRRLAEGAPPLQRIRTDGRMHRWEWLAAPGGQLRKADALDHDDAHDLIGCQDVTWDIAGALVEWELCEAEADDLCRRIAQDGVRVDRTLLAFMRIAYCAFQIGYWTMARVSSPPEELPALDAAVDRYRRHSVWGARGTCLDILSPQ
jgi:hypothetical protein